MRIITLLIISVGLASCAVQNTVQNSSPKIKAQSDTELIKKCFAAYKSAILNDQGQEAVEYVDSRTMQYYKQMLKKTISGDSTEVNSLNIMDKFMVFSIRHRISKEDLLSFNGKQLLVYAIKEGMVGKNSVARNEIGEIVIDDNFAKGQLVSNGTPAPIYFHFYKENEAWKIDLTSIFPVAILAFQKMADDSGQEENEYLFMLLEMITGEKPTNDIWKVVKE